MNYDNFVTEAIEKKRSLPNVDRLISDGALTAHMHSWCGDPDSKEMTLGNILGQRRGFAVADSLERQLALLAALINPDRTRQFCAGILNDSGHFRHTRAELALAYAFVRQGHQVELAFEMPPENEEQRANSRKRKDIDILVKMGGEPRHVEVLSLKTRRLGNSGDVPPRASLLPSAAHARENEAAGSSCLFDAPSAEKLLRAKIKNKYRDKFKVAVENGWPGAPWIALNFAENDAMLIGSSAQDVADRPRWAESVARVACDECPALRGVVLFTYLGYAETADNVWWVPAEGAV